MYVVDETMGTVLPNAMMWAPFSLIRLYVWDITEGTEQLDLQCVYDSVALLWHNAKVLALLKVKCKIH